MGPESSFVIGAQRAIDSIGTWPDFHDAFRGIRNVHLEGFNEQNVLASLALERRDDGVQCSIDELYGLFGTFDCDSVEVTSFESEP